MSEKTTKKLTDSELYILNVLSENKIMVTSNNGLSSYFSWSLYDTRPDVSDKDRYTEQNSKEIPTFLQANKAYDSLWQRGFLTRASKEKITSFMTEKRNAHVDFAWYNHLNILSKEGKQFVNDNPDLFEGLQKKINAEKENDVFLVSKRCETVYFGNSSKREERFGAGSAYRVVRETANRYYVALASEEYNDGVSKNRYNDFVEGYHNKMYIEKSNVLAINVTPEQYKKMTATTQQYIEYQDDLKKQEEEALRPIRETFAQRRKQSMAMFEEELSSFADTTPENGMKI